MLRAAHRIPFFPLVFVASTIACWIAFGACGPQFAGLLYFLLEDLPVSLIHYHEVPSSFERSGIGEYPAKLEIVWILFSICSSVMILAVSRRVVFPLKPWKCVLVKVLLVFCVLTFTRALVMSRPADPLEMAGNWIAISIVLTFFLAVRRVTPLPQPQSTTA